LNEATQEGLQSAFLAIGVSAASVWIGVGGRAWVPPGWLVEAAKRPLDTRTITRLVPICFLLGMLNYLYFSNFDIPLMFSYLGGNRWSAPWSRGQLGGWSSFIDQMPYFGYVLPSLTALLITRRGLLKAETLFAVGCTVVMLLFLSSIGGRRIIGVTVGAGLLVWLQANPGLKLKNIIIVLVSAIAMAFVSQFMLNIRSTGIEGFRDRGSQYESFHVDDNFLRLAQVIDIVPSAHPYIGISQITFALIRPVPRVFWPNKPIDPGFDLAAATRQKGVSLSTTIIGEWYLAYGWIAVIFGGWFHGRLAKAANAIREIGREANNPIIYALAVMILFAGMRSMLDLIVMSYALVAWWGINRLMSPKVPAIA
jgi:oligosaccharide repeat unit polymerase